MSEWRSANGAALWPHYIMCNISLEAFNAEYVFDTATELNNLLVIGEVIEAYWTLFVWFSMPVLVVAHCIIANEIVVIFPSVVYLWLALPTSHLILVSICVLLILAHLVQENCQLSIRVNSTHYVQLDDPWQGHYHLFCVFAEPFDSVTATIPLQFLADDN